jgi:hypothetical protein
LHNTTSFLDLAFGFGRHETCLDDNGGGWKAALSEDLGVAEAKEIENGCGVLGLAREVLLALIRRDETPELWLLAINTRYG